MGRIFKCGLVVVVLGGTFLWGVARGKDSAAQRRSSYTDALYGFSMNAPAFARAVPGSMVVPVIFSGQSGTGFAPNVSVNVNRAQFTRDRYRELSLSEFRKTGLVVNSESFREVAGRPAIEWEYSGTLASRDAKGEPMDLDLRFLALAIIDKDRVVLVTCSCQEKVFQEVAPEFRACLASFKLD